MKHPTIPVLAAAALPLALLGTDVTHSFTDGGVASAVEVNENFAELSGAIGNMAGEVIYRGDVTAVSSHTVSGLDGDTDGIYKIFMNGDLTSTSDGAVYMVPNGLGADSYQNHNWRWESGGTETEESAGISGLWLGRSAYGFGGGFSFDGTLFARTGTYRRLIGRNFFDDDANTRTTSFSASSTWRNSTTNLTSLDFHWAAGTFTGRITIVRAVAPVP